jgi:CheY-like chemotaxis protein
MNKSKSILLIEDDENDQYFFTHMLQSISGTVLYDIAENGKQAIDKLDGADSLPDLIFTDLHMPQMDGVACISELQSKPHLRDIPIIVLSSDTTRLEMVRSLGAKGFIKKTSNITLLKDQI